jgi:hypothetical protein
MTGEKTRTAWRLGGPAVVSLVGLLACRSAGSAAPPPVPPSRPAASLEPAAAQAPHNTLRWKTNDVSNFGYDIFRAESEEGPFVKINNRPVSGALQPGSVQTFEYEDRAIDPRKDYWYYVESISLLGERVRFTPTLKAPAKTPRPSRH